ncbi:hypothetical protein [Laribacter hongkongensis]|uniref:hypothetical protein n=1 Tax=Laribacter hongkongensis TaxID=168471 RepID=UPI001EFE0F44|nr:hypothetical protein [Laribacter hongkongensis]MCG9076211.1 hypothetical protein [Laribacter hongkongensis]
MDFLITAEELGLLNECSLESIKLFLNLRSMMDLRTGLVGVRSKVSMSRLGIEVSYTPPPGSHRPAYSPTRRQIESQLDELERVGLVRRQFEPERRLQLVLKLPFSALVGEVRPVEEAYSSRVAGVDDECDSQSRASAGFDDDGSVQDEKVINSDEAAISVIGSRYKVVSGGGKNVARASLPTTTTADVPALSAEDELMMGRAAQLCVALRRFRVLVHVRQFSDGDGRKLLLDFSDAEILKTAERLHQRYFDDPERSFNLTYLIRVITDISVAREAAPLSRRGLARGVKGTAERPWFLTASGLEAKAEELGIDTSIGIGVVRLEIIKRAGVSRREYESACSDFGVARGY